MKCVQIPSNLKKMNQFFENAGFKAYLVGGAVRDMLLGQKDFAQGENLIYVQKDPANSVKLSHFIPSARFLVGFMTELAPNLRFRGSFGVQYEMGYTDEYAGYYLNGGYIEKETIFSNDPTFSTVIELGLAFSL